MKLSGWGRYLETDCEIARARSDSEAAKVLAQGPLIARGNGRSYGDSAHYAASTLDMRAMNRMLQFDGEQGLLVAEAGVVLGDVVEAFLPRGWFPWVTPGTRFVTLGGMVASDVHGKNHHKEGSFSEYLEWVELLAADGVMLRCSRVENAQLFFDTIGGMGLTGVILRVAMRLRPVESGWIHQQKFMTADLASTLDLLALLDRATYSVAWIDCLSRGRSLGRSVVMVGEHAAYEALADLQKSDRYVCGPRKIKRVPIVPPINLFNPLFSRIFNSLYYWKNFLSRKNSFIDWQTYFYPLDGVEGWNKIYGPKGFVQFQCVLPPETSRKGLTELLRTVSASGQASYLCVLKKMGPAGIGTIAFPRDGYTLAMDFPATSEMPALMERLHQIAVSHGGRFYLTKDAVMSGETLLQSDARIAAFKARRQSAGLNTFKSSQSERIKL